MELLKKTRIERMLGMEKVNTLVGLAPQKQNVSGE